MKKKFKRDAIRVLITGGTLDKRYNPLDGSLNFKNSHLPTIIKQVRCTLSLRLETLLLLDSLDLKPEDRAYILQRCGGCEETKIVITHGTDTMVETGRVLGSAGLKKTIILVGAMVPYSMQGSDSLFNLGGAFIGVQSLPSGVYLIMNGKIFPWDKVKKNRSKGVFEDITDSPFPS